jgi:hypothetical protein
MRFILMMTGPAPKAGQGIEAWSKEDIKAHMAFMQKFNGELKAEGVLAGAEGLDYPPRPKIVRATRERKPSITDGPFVETKEFLFGYWIVKVDTPEQAYEIAARASAAPGPGGVPLNMPIEVRQVMDGPPPID